MIDNIEIKKISFLKLYDKVLSKEQSLLWPDPLISGCLALDIDILYKLNPFILSIVITYKANKSCVLVFQSYFALWLIRRTGFWVWKQIPYE